MEDKKNPPVLFSLSLFPDTEPEGSSPPKSVNEDTSATELAMELGPTSELELEIFPKKEVARKEDKAIRTVADLAADRPLRKDVVTYVLPVVGIGASAAAKALRKSTGKPAAPKKGTAEAAYAGLVEAFAKWRRKRKKSLKKQGYNEETGLIHPKPCEKLPKLSKPVKLKRLNKLPKAQKLSAATKVTKAAKLKRLKKIN